MTGLPVPPKSTTTITKKYNENGWLIEEGIVVESTEDDDNRGTQNG